MSDQISLFDEATQNKAEKRQIFTSTNTDKKTTTEAINELFGISESFELPETLLKTLLVEEEKNRLCDEFMKLDFGCRNDCLRDYFQENNANRSNLKQDYTPDCLCQLISELVPSTDKVIDICAGTGAITIGIGRNIQYQCEELSSASIPVLLLNLALRNVNAVVLQKDVLLNEVKAIYKLSQSNKYSDIEVATRYDEKKADVVVSNPPYSLKWIPKRDMRFEGYELAPAKASDYAFLLDGLSRLSETGQAFYILPAGVLFRGGAEGKIRRQLIENNLIDAIISLPENMFLNTCIPVNILVLNKAKKTDNVLFIVADKMFQKNKKQNIMTDEHIKAIADAYRNRKSIDRFSRVVTKEEIAGNDYNLSVNRYIDTFVREQLPPFSEIVNEVIKTELEVKKSTLQLVEMLQELCGDEGYEKAKQDFIDFFSSQDIVGETMIEYMKMKNLEKRINYITTHAKRKRVPIFDITDFERVKKGKIYSSGTAYIQLSATDGIVRYLEESRELETKYGAFIPKSKYLGSRYLFYMLEYEMEEFLSKYQSGMNINPEIFKHLEVTYYKEAKIRSEIAMTLDKLDAQMNQTAGKTKSIQMMKKIHLNGMFP